MRVVGDMIPDQLFFRSAYEPQPVVLPVVVPKIPSLTPSPVVYIPKEKKSNLLYYILIPVALYVILS